MKKLSIAQAAQMCGLKTKALESLLSLPEDHPRRPKSLQLVDPDHLDAEGVLLYIQRSSLNQGQAPILDDEELAGVLYQAGKMRYGVRNQALIALSNYAGLRAVEMCRLTLGDVVDQEKQLRQRVVLKRARTKNKAPRVMYFTNPALRKYLQAQIDQRFAQGAQYKDPLFVGVYDKTQPIERKNMARIFKYIYARCEHPECTSHSGRRRLGTKVVKDEGLKAAQLVLGHGSAKTTLLYTDYSDQELGAIMERM